MKKLSGIETPHDANLNYDIADEYSKVLLESIS